jgi:DNA polymerase-3 subunit alpha
MPDIDVDFDQRRREEVIDYVGQKYGRDHVVQIGTLNRMKAKGAIRDVARALGLPYDFGDKMAKMVPKELDITLEEALEKSSELRQLCETDEQAKYLMAMAKRLQGLPRNASTHASGVVITTQPTDEFVPLAWGKEDGINTQYDMTTIEQLGLLKMDILGLANLTIIQDAVKLIEKSQGKVIDIDQITFDDAATYTDIGLARTDGVFQLESAGMRSFMQDLKPQNLEDIIAGIALYRPGPMDFIPKYLEGKRSQKAIAYAWPGLEPILAPTYGCFVYQEQVMQIVRDLAGYPMRRIDLIRQAMSKKKTEVMLAERDPFVYGAASEGVPGCVARGIPENTALQIYDDMMDFALYAFNKSHAASYAVVSYQTAYLKHNYPVEYMAALMTSAIGNKSKVAAYIMTCRNMGITLLPPDINMGEAGFTVVNQCILYALTAIKGVGYPIIEALVAERAQRGEFTALQDFMVRMSDTGLHKSAIEYFIKAGALDSLPGTRKQFMAAYKQIADDIQHNKKAALAGQMTLFDLAGDEEKQEFELRLPEVGEYDKDMMLEFEKEVLGIYLSGHPLEEDEELWRSVITNTSSDFYLEAESGTTVVKDRETAVIGGIISEMSTKYTKKNQLMAFLQVEDMAGVCEVIVFPKDYEKYGSSLAVDNRVFVQGRVSLDEEKDGKLICEKVCDFTEVAQTLWIKFADKAAYEASSDWLLELLALSPGHASVGIYLETEKQSKTLPPELNVGIEASLLEGLRDSFGEGNVKVAWQM